MIVVLKNSLTGADAVRDQAPLMNELSQVNAQRIKPFHMVNAFAAPGIRRRSDASEGQSGRRPSDPRREAQHELEQLTEKYAYVPYWFYSIVSIGLSDWQGALDALDNAFNDHEPCLVGLKVDPVFDPLASRVTILGHGAADRVGAVSGAGDALSNLSMLN
jgi:hypothetical protein